MSFQQSAGRCFAFGPGGRQRLAKRRPAAMNKWIAGILNFLFLVVLCGCTKPTAEMPSDFEGAKLAAKVTALHEILSADDVAGLSGADAGKIGIHYENFSSDPAQHSLQYHWPTGNILSLPGGHSIDEYHSAGIAFVELMTADEFKQRYGTNAGLQQKVNELGKDSTLSTEVAIAEAKYLGEYAKSRELESLDGVGELAFWETPVQALHVFADGVSFTVTINVGENEETNRGKATELVRLILNQ